MRCWLEHLPTRHTRVCQQQRLYFPPHLSVFVCSWSVDECCSETRTAVQGSITTQGVLSPASPISSLAGECCSSLPPQVSSAQRQAWKSRGSWGHPGPDPLHKQGLRHSVHPSTAGGKWFSVPQNTHTGLQLPKLSAGMTHSANPLQVPRSHHTGTKAQRLWSWYLLIFPGSWTPFSQHQPWQGKGHQRGAQACCFCPCFKSRNLDDDPISSYKPVTSGLPSLTINFCPSEQEHKPWIMEEP